MRSQLLIRPGPNDHRVIEDLLAPGGSGIFRGVRPVVDQLVVDATAVVYRPGLAAVAARAGIPFLVDPMTPFCQVALADDDRWAALPYGSAPAMSIGDLATASARDDLVTRVLSFEVDHGASVVIPPYFYSRSPGDPWFDVSLDLLERTARHMARSDVRLPLLPILCAQLHQFGSPDTWAAGIDRFVRIAGAAAAARVGLFLSPMGEADDTYGNVERLFASALRVRGTGISVIAWGQGVYGPALVAAGLDGYETGIGMRERTDVAAALNRRRPRVVEPPRSRRTPQTIFLQPLGRSLLLSVAEHLLDDLAVGNVRWQHLLGVVQLRVDLEERRVQIAHEVLDVVDCLGEFIDLLLDGGHRVPDGLPVQPVVVVARHGLGQSRWAVRIRKQVLRLGYKVSQEPHRIPPL